MKSRWRIAGCSTAVLSLALIGLSPSAPAAASAVSKGNAQSTGATASPASAQQENTQNAAQASGDQRGVAATDGKKPKPLHYQNPAVKGSTRTVTGNLVVEAIDGPKPRLKYTLQTPAGKTVDLDLTKSFPKGVTQGKVTAELTQGGAVASATVTPAAVAAPTPGPQHAYVVKVTNRGQYLDSDGSPASDADIKGIVQFGLNRWKAQASGYITSFTEVGGLVEAKASGTACVNGSDLWNQFDDELFPGVDFGAGSGNHLIVMQPGDCGTGIGTVGSSISDGGKVTSGFNQLNRTTITHEVGHNFGLAHSHSYYCDSGTCEEDAYGNTYTPMGYSQIKDPPVAPSSLSSFQRSQLDIASQCEVQPLGLADGQKTVSASYDLFGRGTDVGTRGVKALDPVSGATYYFDWRNALGLDSNTSYARNKNKPERDWLNNGVTVEKVVADGSTDLIGHPKTAGGNNFALTAGQTYTADGITLKVDAAPADPSTSTTGAKVTVTLTDPSKTDGPALPTQPKGTGTVIGQPNAGETLGVQTGGWAGGTCFRYQWLLDGQPIDGAVAPTYTVPADQAGKTITARITGQRTGYAPTTTVATGAADPGQWPDTDLVPNIAYQFTDRASELDAAITAGGVNGSPLVQRGSAGDDSRFTLVKVSDGVYQLKNVTTGRCADVAGGSTSEGQRVVDYTCSSATNQQWRVQQHPLGGSAIRNVKSGMCLMPKGSATDSDTTLVQGRCRLISAQAWDPQVSVPPADQWTPVAKTVPTVPYSFTNQQSGLDAGIPTGDSNTRVIQRGSGDEGAQFTLVPNDDGSYGLKNVQDEDCMEVIGHGAGAYGFTYTCDTTSPEKKWKLLENPAGGVSIYNVRDKLCLAPKGGSNDAGAQLVLGSCTVQPVDRWKLSAIYPPVDDWAPSKFSSEVPWTFDNLASKTSAGVPAGSAPKDDADLVIRARDGDFSQFRFEPNTDGTVRIRNVHTSTCVDVYGAASRDNAKVGTYSCGSADNQKWRLLANPAGGTAFRSVSSGKCLTTNNGDTSDGTTLAQTTCAIDPVQRWDVTAAVPPVDQWAPVTLPGGQKSIEQDSSGLAIGTYNPGLSFNYVALQDPGLATAKWSFVQTSAGNAHIVNTSTKRCLDLRGYSYPPGAQVHTYSCGDSADSPTQEWKLLKNPVGDIAFRNVKTGLCLSTKDGGSATGTITTLATCGYDRDQRWTLQGAELRRSGTTTDKRG